jgi:hypothetical protein
MPNDSHVWYIACHAPAQGETIAPQFAEYHPFGASFILTPWDLEEAIDAYEDKPRKRVPVDVQKTGEVRFLRIQPSTVGTHPRSMRYRAQHRGERRQGTMTGKPLIESDRVDGTTV